MDYSGQNDMRLSEMIKMLKESEGFSKFIKKTTEKLKFHKHNILNLTPEKVESLHMTFKSKLNNNHHFKEEQPNY
jgi:hypothetical protein